MAYEGIKKIFAEIGRRLELAGARAPGPFGLITGSHFRPRSEDSASSDRNGKGRPPEPPLSGL